MVWAEGWAVIDGSGINVRTVSDSRRAAIVNWLVTNGYMILAHHTDEEIERLWEQAGGGGLHVKVQPVTVRAL